MSRTLVTDDEPPQRTVIVSRTANESRYTLVLAPDAPIVLTGIVAEDLPAGTAAELVIDPVSGRGAIRRRSS